MMAVVSLKIGRKWIKHWLMRVRICFLEKKDRILGVNTFNTFTPRISAGYLLVVAIQKLWILVQSKA